MNYADYFPLGSHRFSLIAQASEITQTESNYEMMSCQGSGACFFFGAASVAFMSSEWTMENYSRRPPYPVYAVIICSVTTSFLHDEICNLTWHDNYA